MRARIRFMDSKKDDGQPATQRDMRTLRTELKADIHRLAVGLVKTNERIDALERSLSEKIDRFAERILGAIDAFAVKAEAYDRKSLSHGAILQDHEARLREHGRRLSHLERPA